MKTAERVAPNAPSAFRRSRTRPGFFGQLLARRRLAFAIAMAIGLAPCSFGATKSHLDLRAEAQVALQRHDYAAAREAITAALALRPDSPRYLYTLAALAALEKNLPLSVRYLRQIAALGVVMPVERDPDFAALQGSPPFIQVLQLFADNRSPRGEVEVVAELPGRTGIIEGIAFRPRTGDLFLSDVFHRCVWRRDRTGQVTRFSAEDEELLGIFGLALDEPRGALWATMTAVPEMSGYTPALKGAAALAEFSLGTSELKRVVLVPDDGHEHGLGDLLVAPDGTIYVTDSKAPVIWKLSPDAEEFQKLVESPEFSSLQGIVLWKNELIVADYANGLFAIDPRTSRIRAFAPPKDTTLLGLDGLLATPEGIFATQNGVEPQRVVRIAFTPDAATITGVTVLAAALPQLQDISLITLVNDRPTLVAGAGWDGFDPEKTRIPPAHPVRILQVAVP